MKIPDAVKFAIDEHVTHGYVCGDFVTAVLENNLSEAFGRADERSTAAMRDIVMYLYNHVPSECWGSKEKVKAWIEHDGLKGYGKPVENYEVE